MIGDSQVPDDAVVLENRSVENGCAGFKGSGDDEALEEAVLGLVLDLQGFLVNPFRGQDLAVRQQKQIQIVGEEIQVQGVSASFAVVATGAAPFTYQWEIFFGGHVAMMWRSLRFRSREDDGCTRRRVG